MRARFSHIRDLLSRHKVARSLLEESSAERDLIARTKAALPLALRPHCLDASISGSALTLFFDSSAWLTRARFLSDRMLTALRDLEISTVHYRIRPPTEKNTSNRARSTAVQRLSDRAAAHLYEAASHQTDTRLSNAFRRLAQRHAADGPIDEDGS